MERRLAETSVIRSSARSSRVRKVRAAMLVTSLLAGSYVYLQVELRHGRRRTVLQRHDDVTVAMDANNRSRDHYHLTTTTTIGGE